MKNLLRSLMVVLALSTGAVFAQAAAAPTVAPAKVHAHGKVAKASKKGHKKFHKKHKKPGRKKSA
jgi:hypothetical protein